MIRTVDTLGTFQIESRAQMAMLPRPNPGSLQAGGPARNQSGAYLIEIK
jgi:hypothetical protein